MNILAVLSVTMEGHYSKFTIVIGAIPYTNDANMGGIAKLLRGNADKFLARPGRKNYTHQNRDVFNILPTKLNILLKPLL